MSLNIDDFKERLVGGGARPNLFRAFIQWPSGVIGADTSLVSFMCKAAQLPGSTMGIIPVPFRGRQLKIAGDRTFDPWTVTIINDTDFQVRNAMERWMNYINAHVTNTGETNPSAYQTDLKVEQLDKDETVLNTYRFVGSFPTAVSPIDVSYEAVDAIEEFSVEFQYQYWTNAQSTS